MPGGDFAATNAQGENGSMVSFGFFATEFTTPNGQKLDINPNTVKARITLPANAPDPSQNNASLWVFNTSTNTWNSGGAVQKIGNEVTMPVTTLTFSNLDAFQGKAEINGSVTDCDGKKAAGIEVKITGYSNSKKIISYTSKTNGNGNYLFKNVAAPSKSMPLSYKVEVKSETKEIADIKDNDKMTVNFDICQDQKNQTGLPYAEITIDGKLIKFNTPQNFQSSPVSSFCDAVKPGEKEIISFFNKEIECSFRVPVTKGSYSIDGKNECSGLSHFILMYLDNSKPGGFSKVFKSNYGESNVQPSGSISSDGNGNYTFDLKLIDGTENTIATTRVTGKCFYPINK